MIVRIIICMVFTVSMMVFPHSGFSLPVKKEKSGSDFVENLQYDSVFFIKKKDPVLAGMLSWYVPGLGQFYSGKVLKGTIFLITEYSLLIGAFFYYFNVDFAAGGDSGFNLKVDAKRTDLGVVETDRRNIFFGLLAFVGVLHIYNISDAVMSTREFNRDLDIKRHKLKNKYPNLKFSYNSKEGMYIGIETRL